MARPKSIEEKVGEWERAYLAVSDELNRYVSAVSDARLPNNRTAAVVAAMLVGQGVVANRLPDPLRDDGQLG